MRNRKTFIGMAIFIAILVLGVGYAAVTGVELEITGGANVKANADFSVVYDTTHDIGLSTNEKIDWDNDELHEKEQAVVTATYDDTDSATMTVYLDSSNREAYAIYKILNKSPELEAMVSAEITSNFADTNTDYLSVTPELYLDENCQTLLDDDSKIAAKTGVAYLKVTVSLTKLPVEDITNASFNIKMIAEPSGVALSK